MKCRLCFALLLTVLFGVVLVARVPQGVAHADGDCQDSVPMAALFDSTLSTAGDAVDDIQSDWDTDAGLVAPALAPGTSFISTAAGHTAVAVAAFFAASWSTCMVIDNRPSFLDWINGDSMAASETTYGPTDATFGNGTTFCTSLMTAMSITPATPTGPDAECRALQLPGAINLQKWRTNEDVASSTRAGVTIVTPSTQNGMYPDLTGGASSRQINVSGSMCNGSSSASGSTCPGNASVTKLVLAVSCTNDVGGVCGIQPGSVLMGFPDTLTSTAGGGSYSLLQSMSEQANEVGWERKIRTDIYCHGAVSGWISLDSNSYFDKVAQTRVPVESCPVGYVATRLFIQRYPVGSVCVAGSLCTVTTPAGGAGTVTTGSPLIDWTAPSWWTTGTDAPDPCITYGGTCGEPAYESSTCKWGGITVPSAYCDDVQGGTDVRVNGDIDAAPTTPGEAFDTRTDTPYDPPPDDGDGGVTVNVPIDDGGEDEPRGTGIIVGNEDEEQCWPDGWGWFNPAEWVYRPIKCALTWAFVPDGDSVETTFGELQDELEAQFPFSLGFLLIDFAATLGAELEDPTGTGCFDMPSSFSFGSFSVPTSDVCIGDGVEPGTPQRQLLATLMIAPLLWAVCTHAVRTMRGVDTSGD